MPKARKLKLFNGGDWDYRGGHLYVAAWSQKDAVDLVNRAYRKIRHLEGRPDVGPFTIHELNIYWSKGHWGNAMNGVVPERGVWWAKGNDDGQYNRNKPERILLGDES